MVGGVGEAECVSKTDKGTSWIVASRSLPSFLPNSYVQRLTELTDEHAGLRSLKLFAKTKSQQGKDSVRTYHMYTSPAET